jgi:iron complex transport system substrate-binding protein
MKAKSLGAATSFFLALALAQQQPEPALRIVSLVPSMTEVLYAIGAGGDVVGVSSYDRFPPEVASQPRVGALLDPDFERILSLKPTLVVVYASQRELVDRLARLNIGIVETKHGGLSDVPASIRALGRRVGRDRRAEEVAASIEQSIDQVRKRVAGRSRPRTALIFGREPGSLRGIYASAGVGFMHDMLEAAGGDDVFADVRRENLQVSVEMLLARAPEVIIEVHPSDGWTAARRERERAVWGALPGLPAVKSGRVYLVADDRLWAPGPRVAEGVRLLAQVLHP